MKPHQPDMGYLFEQLGLSSDASSVARFIHHHTVIGNGVHLHEAVSWSPSQAAFLRESIALDGEWSGVVDQLNLALHA